MFEYIGLICVFLAYGGIYFFGWGVAFAAALYVVDHLFFALAFALKTYFQKIAAPGDIAPTSAVAFTINHIAAVFLPRDFWAISGLCHRVRCSVWRRRWRLFRWRWRCMIPRHPAPRSRDRVLERLALPSTHTPV